MTTCASCISDNSALGGHFVDLWPKLSGHSRHLDFVYRLTCSVATSEGLNTDRNNTTMVDSLGSEVSSKIRAAIKAKLVELNAYVDDELPDYIMVMVANKKSEDVMREDLALFLGDNTVAFVGWLAQVLEKLEKVTLGKADSIGRRKLDLVHTHFVIFCQEKPRRRWGRRRRRTP